MTAIIHGSIMLFARFPKLGGFVGLIIAIAFSFLGIASWNDLQKMPQAPRHISLEEIPSVLNTAQNTWVEIEKVNWDCQNIVYSDLDNAIRTEVVFTDDSSTLLGVALFSEAEKLTCEDLPKANVTGVASKMTDTFYERMPKRGFNIKNHQGASTRVDLCMFCGRSNSIGLILISAVIAPAGLAFYPICLSLRRRYEEKGLL